jgi:hypothetical protein
MSTNLFEPWIPMYQEGAVPTRPWWRLRVIMSTAEGSIHHRYERIDGATLDRERKFWSDGSLGWSVERRTQLADWIGEASGTLDTYDETHPLPAPAPMVGQVWCDTLGCRSILATGVGTVTSYWVMWGDESGTKSTRHTLNEEEFFTEPWPPAAVLVAGPTPWGRDRPWAPAGWTTRNHPKRRP